MCGLIGLVCRNGAASDALAAAGRGLRVLEHRGPDDRRAVVSVDERALLGHARLAIVDVEGGRQPFVSEDGEVSAVVNGEFFDHEAVRASLERAGHRFATGSDSEILVHLYEEHGTTCLEHLRGDFSFLLWDARNQALFAARDRFGVKPLYYASGPDGLWLASEVKALFAAGAVEARWHREALFQHLLACLDDEQTLYAGVRQVPPASYLLATPESFRIVRYWDLDYPVEDGNGSQVADEDAVRAVRDGLREAVACRLRADVPVGCYLSGGIDSAAVLGFAAESGAPAPKAFTVGFGDEAYDESALAQETAAAVGSDVELIRVTDADLAENLAPAVWHAENLGYNLHGVARFLQSRAARAAGVKVVLSGDGGDELFAGYGHCRRDAGRANGDGGCRAAERILGRAPTWLAQLERGRRPLRLVLDDDFVHAYGERDPFAALLSSLDVARQVRGRPFVRQGLYLWDHSFLPNHLLLCDRVEMAHSIEVRPVFFDHKLVELTRPFPVSALVRGSYEKWVLREAMAGVVPDAVRLRPKHPFTAPHVARKIDGPLWRLANDVLAPEAIRDVGFLSAERVSGLLTRLPTLPLEQRVALDQCLMLCISAVLLNDSYRMTW